MRLIELIIFVVIFSVLILLKPEALLAIIIVGLIIYAYYNYHKEPLPPNKKKDVFKENLDFVEIMELLQFSKRYDKTKYEEINNQLHTFMKIYVNLLADRWNIQLYLPTLYLLRLEILEILYSLYIVLPVKMRHVFGFKPLDRLNDIIHKFDQKSKDMIEVVRLYGKHDKGMIHIEDYNVAPHNLKENRMLP